MTNIMVAVPDEVAEVARIQGLLEPQRLTSLLCEAFSRSTASDEAMEEPFNPGPDECRALYEDLMAFAGAAGPGLPEDFAENHNHYIHGWPK